MKKDLIEILEVFSNLNIGSMKYTCQDFQLELSKLPNHDGMNCSPIQQSSNLESLESKIKTEGIQCKQIDLYPVKAPIVGIFYSKASPEKDAFVRVGDIVEEGQVLCILEAMKMFNEVKSPIKGRVVKIHFQDEDLVGFEDILIEMEAIC